MSKHGVILSYVGKVIRREREYRSGTLKQAILDLTFRCNLKCEMCGIWRDKNPRWQNELGEQEWLRVIDDLADYGCERVHMSGGEPTIVPSFVRLMKRIKDRGMHTSINTNGALLEKLASDVCSYMDVVYVSVDAPDERHDEIRGARGSFDKAVGGIKDLIEYKRRHNLTRPLIHMAMVLSRMNADCLPGVAQLGDDMGVDIISMQYVSASPPWAVEQSVMDGRCISTDRFAILDPEKLFADADGIRTIRDGMRNLPKTKRAMVLSEPTRSLSDESLLTGVFPTERCTPVSNVLMILPDGETTICAHLAGYTMGNVRAQSIGEIWEGEAHRRLKKQLRERLFPVCRNCSYFSNTLTPSQILNIAMKKRLATHSAALRWIKTR